MQWAVLNRNPAASGHGRSPGQLRMRVVQACRQSTAHFLLNAVLHGLIESISDLEVLVWLCQRTADELMEERAGFLGSRLGSSETATSQLYFEDYIVHEPLPLHFRIVGASSSVRSRRRGIGP